MVKGRRDKRRSFAALAVVVLCAATLASELPASAHHFGDTPKQDVIDQATSASRCTGLSASKLASMVLAPTWRETGSGTQAPSPMTLGRWDMDSDLKSYANTPRDFWHAGLGAWQLDAAGVGANMAAFQAVNTWTAAGKVADTMAYRYCSYSGTAAERRAYAFGPWNACSGGACETLFLEHYCSGTDSVCQVPTDSMPRWGGMRQRTCTITRPTGSFACWFIDPDKAEGYTGWRFEDKDGSGTYSPLSFAFYDYWGGQLEYRHWLRADTNYGRGTVFATSTGENPRLAGVLDWVQSEILCDRDYLKGAC